MNFKTEFVGLSESPLSDSSAFSAVNIDAANNTAVGSSSPTSGAAGVALLASPLPKSRDQRLVIAATMKEEQCAALTVSTITEGATTTVQFSGNHGRTGWGYLTFSGVWTTDTPQGSSLNGTQWVDYDAAADSVTVAVDTTGETYVDAGTGTPNDCHIDLLARIDSTATASGYDPNQGYICRLSYLNGSVRKLSFLRHDFDSSTTDPGGIYQLAITADLGIAGTGATNLSNSSPQTDLGVGQVIRFYCEETDAGHVRLRGYLNSYDDSVPTLEFVDRGDDTSSSSAAPLSFAKSIGQVGFRFWSEVGIAAYFEAADYAVERLEGLQPHDITLSDVRTKVKRRLERSTSGVLPDALYNEFINEAQYEIIEQLGQMAFFVSRRESINLPQETSGPDGEVRFTLGPHVRLIESISSVTTGVELDWQVIGIHDGGRLHIQLSTQDGGPPYEMVYFARVEEMADDTDQVTIPREHIGVLIEKAILKGAQYHSDTALEKSSMIHYQGKYSILANSMSKIQRQSRRNERFSGPRYRPTNRYVPAWQVWGRF